MRENIKNSVLKEKSQEYTALLATQRWHHDLAQCPPHHATDGRHTPQNQALISRLR